jgi:hypothetical protein
MTQSRKELRGLEGKHVRVALTDGSRIGDCILVSAGRGSVNSLWLFNDRRDLFISLAEVKAVAPKSRHPESRAG